jgi:hypothetical protein
VDSGDQFEHTASSEISRMAATSPNLHLFVIATEFGFAEGGE